jgi:hypothetical protein
MSLTIEKSSWDFQSSKLASTTFFDKTSSEIALPLQYLLRIKKSTNFQESKYNLLIYNALQVVLRAFPPKVFIIGQK